MYLSTKILIENWLNILYQDKKKLIDYFEKMFLKLSFLTIFQEMYVYLTLVLLIR